MASSFPNPRRLLVSNQTERGAEDHAEPGVEVLVDTLEPVAVMPQFKRVQVATHTAIPTSNDGAYVSLNPRVNGSCQNKLTNTSHTSKRPA